MHLGQVRAADTSREPSDTLRNTLTLHVPWYLKQILSTESKTDRTNKKNEKKEMSAQSGGRFRFNAGVTHVENFFVPKLQYFLSFKYIYSIYYYYFYSIVYLQYNPGKTSDKLITS